MSSINVVIGKNTPKSVNVSASKPTKGIELLVGSGKGVSVKSDTTAGWNAAMGYIPPKGEIIVYTDYATVDGKDVPGIKIGGGNGYVQDLAFVGEDVRVALLEHLADMNYHIRPGERAFWNNKLNVNDSFETDGETLIFNRN